MIPKMLTVNDVAKILQMSYDKTLDFIKYSGVEYLQIRRQYRVPEDKLRDFLMKNSKKTIDWNDG